MPSTFSWSQFVKSGGPARVPAYLCFWLSFISLGMDLGIVGSIQASDQWQNYFNSPSGSTLGLLNGISTLGMVIGAPIGPYVGGPFGRKKGAMVGSIITIIATALQAGAVNVHMYLAARFFIGFGFVIAHTSSVPYLSEFAPDAERTIAMGIYVPIYFVGSILISWTCYATVNYPTDWSWRGPSILQAAPSVFQLLLLLYAPESPRWLATKGRYDECYQILVKWHGRGEENEEVKETFKAITLASQQSKDEGRWIDMVNTKASRIRTVIIAVSACFSQWSGNSLISYYIVTLLNSVGYTDPKTQTLFNGMLSVWGLIWNCAVAPLAQKYGRRKIFCIGAGSMLVTWTIFTAGTGAYEKNPDKHIGGMILAMIVLFNMGYGMCWSAVAFYPTELWSSAMRAKAQGVNAFFDYMALFVSIYVNPIAIDAIGWKYFIVYIGLLCLELTFVYLFYVETNKHSIEDIVDYWNGQMGEPKWFGGPGSYKMMNENARMSAEKRAAASLKDANSASVSVQDETKDEKEVTAAVVVLPSI